MVDLGPSGLRELAKSCQAGDKQVYPFLSAVQLDLERPLEKQIGLSALFQVWCRKAVSGWLSPVPYFTALSETLLKFVGPLSALAPFMNLVIEVTESGISPHTFLNYVLYPRMAGDHNWRQWKEHHLRPLEEIASLMLRMSEVPPFDREQIISGTRTLSRDIILLKFAGRPLSRYAAPVILDRGFLDSYADLWSKISLDDLMSLNFLRNNIFNLIYALSGKMDAQQLTALMKRVPEIEKAFSTQFSSQIDIAGRARASYERMHLYNADYASPLSERRVKGFTDYDVVEEVSAYLDIIQSLMKSHSGLHLCGYFASLLKARKDPVMAHALARMVAAITDNGGMHIFMWHTGRLLALDKLEYNDYIDKLVDNGGFDPEYPEPGALFSDLRMDFDTADTRRIGEKLGLEFDDKSKPGYRDLLELYMQKHPESRDDIERFQKELANGVERGWDRDFLHRLDLYSPDLHKPLLKSVIRGIDKGYSRSMKSSSLIYLYDKYGEVNDHEAVSIRKPFRLPVSALKNSLSLEKRLRRKLNVALFVKAWSAIFPEGSQSGRRVESWLKEQLDSAEEGLVRLELAGEEKKVRRLELEVSLMKEGELLLRQEKGIGGLISRIVITAEYSRKELSLSIGLMQKLLERFGRVKAVETRMNILKADAVPERFTLSQLGYFINLLETLRESFFYDPEVRAFFSDEERTSDLGQKLAPFLATKRKELGQEALDAAYNRVSGLDRLRKERSFWIREIEKRGSGEDIKQRPFVWYSSKSFMDAYYGDMGGVCLSSRPQAIRSTSLQPMRLVDPKKASIEGAALLYRNRTLCRSTGDREYWFLFAMNPLKSVMDHLGYENQLRIYLNLRLAAEQLAVDSGLPVYLPGIRTPGLLSNNRVFAELILKFEMKMRPKSVVDAYGLSLYFAEEEFAVAVKIIDPDQTHTLFAESALAQLNSSPAGPEPER